MDITGTAGDDTIVQGDRPGIRIFALGGADRIELDLEGDAGGRNFVDAGDGDDLVINDHEDGSEILLGRGNDVYVGRGFGFSVERSDVVRAGEGNDTIAVTTNKSAYFGDAGDDLLVSEGHRNSFHGGAGNDTISYELRDESNVVGGTGVSIDLGQGFALTGNTTSEDLISIENAIGTNAGDEIFGSGVANSLSGRGGNDQLVGRAGADRLDGGAGADEMIGGAGDDTYVVDNVNDIVDELNDGGSGIDTVLSGISFSLVTSNRLGGAVENLTLTGTASINGTGNALANTLLGNAGANVLNGGAGADRMQGLSGADTYVVDNVGDVVIEQNVAGIDKVNAAVTFTLGAFVENLTLTGTANINGTGNTQANVLVGNTGANVLNGGAGADTMTGGRGSDTYVVDNVGDVVVELNETGIDRVNSSVTYSLSGVYVENLTLTGTASINATGNSLVNVLTGNTGANILNGGAGADTMTGGLGADTYVVDNVGDRVVELNEAGIDLVTSRVTYSLGGTYAENLTLTGTTNINATGNSLANILNGNTGGNVLSGGGGNDTLFGGAGADTLTGGSGADVFIYKSTAESAGSAFDRITDLSDTDVINLSAIDSRTDSAGNNAFSLVDAFTGVSGQMTVTFSAGTNLTTILMDTNGDRVADMKIIANGNHDNFDNFIF